MYEAIIYFAGPKTIFSGKLAEDEIIMRRPLVFRWAALSHARAVHARLDPQRCGYVVRKGVEVIEHVEPMLKQPLSKGHTASHLTG